MLRKSIQMHTQRAHQGPQIEHLANTEAQHCRNQQVMMAASLIVEVARLLLEAAKTFIR